MSDKRFTVFPTRMTLTMYQGKLKAAEKGHSLLKKKSDALTVRFRGLLKEIVAQKENLGDMMSTASFALSHAFRDAGDFGRTVVENVSTPSFRIQLTQENIAGVRLPQFKSVTGGAGLQSDLTGLAKGGQRVQIARNAYQNALSSLVSLASLQTSFVTLDEVIRTTNRRVNALEYVMIPKFENTIHYIESELDESERENFFRLKKVQGVKKKQANKREAERVERTIAAGGEVGSSDDKPSSMLEGAGKSMIGDEGDDDDTTLF